MKELYVGLPNEVWFVLLYWSSFVCCFLMHEYCIINRSFHFSSAAPTTCVFQVYTDVMVLRIALLGRMKMVVLLIIAKHNSSIALRVIAVWVQNVFVIIISTAAPRLAQILAYCKVLNFHSEKLALDYFFTYSLFLYNSGSQPFLSLTVF